MTPGMELLLLLLIPLWGVTSDKTNQTLLAVCGSSILFQVNIPKSMEINSVFWSYTGTEKKTTLAIAKNESFRIIPPRFENRVDFQHPSFSLKLSDVNEEDSGIYEAKIFTNGATMYRTFNLQVCAKEKENNHATRIQWSCYQILLIISLGTLAFFFK